MVWHFRSEEELVTRDTGFKQAVSTVGLVLVECCAIDVAVPCFDRILDGGTGYLRVCSEDLCRSVNGTSRDDQRK
jgi:hypothetical protein